MAFVERENFELRNQEEKRGEEWGVEERRGLESSREEGSRPGRSFPHYPGQCACYGQVYDSVLRTVSCGALHSLPLIFEQLYQHRHSLSSSDIRHTYRITSKTDS